MKKFIVLSLVVALFLANLTIGNAVKIKNILKNAVKVEVVRQSVRAMAEPLNDFINGLLGQRNAEVRDMTKVVPIFMAGINTDSEVGMAQVAGPAELVSQVRCVWEIDSRFGGNGRFTIKVYIPSNSMNPFKLDRVGGVGVSAIIAGSI